MKIVNVCNADGECLTKTDGEGGAVGHVKEDGWKDTGGGWSERVNGWRDCSP